jgi:hypothetical protein
LAVHARVVATTMTTNAEGGAGPAAVVKSVHVALPSLMTACEGGSGLVVTRATVSLVLPLAIRCVLDACHA